MVCDVFAALQRLIDGKSLGDGDHEILAAAGRIVGESTLRARLELFRRVWPRLATLGAPEAIAETAWRLWLPFACRLAESHRRPSIQGVLGPQGSGKSTLATAVAAILAELGVRAATLSIDDLYLTAAERAALRLAEPELVWRGPPGTHDLELGLRTLAAVRSGSAPLWLPRFDKGAAGGVGERFAWVVPAPGIALAGRIGGGHFYLESCSFAGQFLPLPERMGAPPPIALPEGPLQWHWVENRVMAQGAWGSQVFLPEALPVGWQLLAEPPEVLLFEGWCLGVRPVAGVLTGLAQLSNCNLQAYLPLWQLLDHLLVLRPLEREWSYTWRLAAERQRRSGMDDATIRAFVAYFQQALPWEIFVEPLIAVGACNWVVDLGADHQPLAVRVLS